VAKYGRHDISEDAHSHTSRFKEDKVLLWLMSIGVSESIAKANNPFGALLRRLQQHREANGERQKVQPHSEFAVDLSFSA
jgi:hypothetical protein